MPGAVSRTEIPIGDGTIVELIVKGAGAGGIGDIAENLIVAGLVDIESEVRRTRLPIAAVYIGATRWITRFRHARQTAAFGFEDDRAA